MFVVSGYYGYLWEGSFIPHHICIYTCMYIHWEFLNCKSSSLHWNNRKWTVVSDSDVVLLYDACNPMAITISVPLRASRIQSNSHRAIVHVEELCGLLPWRFLLRSGLSGNGGGVGLVPSIAAGLCGTAYCRYWSLHDGSELWQHSTHLGRQASRG